MTIEQIIELGKMGYTKEDIEEMNNGTPNDSTKEGAGKTETTEKPEEESNVKKKNENDNDSSKSTDAIMAELKSLKESVQAINRDSAQGGTEKKDVTEMLNEFTIDMMGGK